MEMAVNTLQLNPWIPPLAHCACSVGMTDCYDLARNDAFYCHPDRGLERPERRDPWDSLRSFGMTRNCSPTRLSQCLTVSIAVWDSVRNSAPQVETTRSLP